MACCGCCSRRASSGSRGSRWPLLLLAFLAVSAIPLALIAALERSPSPNSVRYRSHGLLRECAKWDPAGRRFLASTFLAGGVAEISAGVGSEERLVVADGDVAGNSSFGIAVDGQRGRLLVVYADPWGMRSGAVAAYDLQSWGRLFLAPLSGPGDGKSFADDVAVDEQGNAYVTDCKANKIWKVGLNGELLSVIRSDVFVQRKEWYNNAVGLNGIVYHPNGYLLVIHTSSGYLFKVDPVKEEVAVVQVRGSLLMGDGLELLSPTKLVVAGSRGARIVESSDDWETAIVTERYLGPLHRVATAATVKDGKVYINYMFGGGLTKWTHVIAEAVFLPVSST